VGSSSEALQFLTCCPTVDHYHSSFSLERSDSQHLWKRMRESLESKQILNATKVNSAVQTQLNEGREAQSEQLFQDGGSNYLSFSVIFLTEVELSF